MQYITLTTDVDYALTGKHELMELWAPLVERCLVPFDNDEGEMTQNAMQQAMASIDCVVDSFHNTIYTRNLLLELTARLKENPDLYFVFYQDWTGKNQQDSSLLGVYYYSAIKNYVEAGNTDLLATDSPKIILGAGSNHVALVTNSYKTNLVSENQQDVVDIFLWDLNLNPTKK